MTGNDDKKNVDRALDKAADFDLLGSLSADKEKRDDYRTKAKFQRSIADEIRSKLNLDDQEDGHSKTGGENPPQHRPDGDASPV
jgi:hypothetical protein